MFEICALLAQKKAPKARKASGPKIAAGKVVMVWGRAYTVVGKDTRYANAWFITDGPNQTSVSRDMIVVA
jgi:hypothetical protein